MSKNGANATNDNSGSDQSKADKAKTLEHPKAAAARLTKEILDECKLIATGNTESCFTLVEKTKQLMDAESKF